ncbi:MAG: DDE-type integrase/transposase/recombinase [Caulobacterales bacterium]
MTAFRQISIFKRLLKNTGIHPEALITDGLYSYKSAARALGCLDRHRPGRLRENNRAENSHLPIRRRERKMQRFNPKDPRSVSFQFMEPSTPPSPSSVT